MRLHKMLSISVCCLAAAIPAWGQTTKTPAIPGILGYMDPHTGVFHPIPGASSDDAEAPPATTFTGTINLTITITVKTSGLTSFTCVASTSVVDGTTSPTVYGESDTVLATGSGSTRTCTLSIPYSWSLTTQSSDTMTTSYTVTGIASTGTPARSADRTPLDSRKVPASGATTTLTASVTL